MKREIVAVCTTVLIIAFLLCWHTRYEFVHTNTGIVLGVGDRWTGCVDYAAIDTQFVDDKSADPDEFGGIPQKEIRVGQMIGSEC